MNKYLIAVFLVLIFAGLALYTHVDFAMVLSSSIIVLALLAWFKNVKPEKVEKKPEPELFTGEEDVEYHNDFSKVPAGTADEIPPPPRSIGYGYGDGGRSTYEDLERIGIDTGFDKKEK